MQAGRMKLQDYTAVLNYLTDAQWQQLLGDEASRDAKLRTVTDHAVALGLRNPTENTIQMITALFYMSGLFGGSNITSVTSP